LSPTKTQQFQSSKRVQMLVRTILGVVTLVTANLHTSASRQVGIELELSLHIADQSG